MECRLVVSSIKISIIFITALTLTDPTVFFGLPHASSEPSLFLIVFLWTLVCFDVLMHCIVSCVAL
jgi:hypothetical protein